MSFHSGVENLTKHALAVSFLSFDGFDVLCLVDALLGLPEIPLVLQRKKEYYGRQCFHRLSTGISLLYPKTLDLRCFSVPPDLTMRVFSWDLIRLSAAFIDLMYSSVLATMDAQRGQMR